MALENNCGYPSLSRPWKRYYRETPVRQFETVQSIYELVFSSYNQSITSNAIEYLRASWTYKDLKILVDKASDAFASINVKQGDVVLVGLTNCPETVITLLALNKIGAVSEWFDVRTPEQGIHEYIKLNHCKCVVLLTMLVPAVINSAELLGVEHIISVDPTDSASALIQLVSRFKKDSSKFSEKQGKVVSFKNFIKSGVATNDNVVTFDRTRPSIMIQSSGTTGKPKTIVHSDCSAIAAVRSLAYSDLPIIEGKRLLNLLPPWIAYGLGEAIIYPLAMGTTVILSPTFDPDAIIPYIGKFTVSMAAPFHYRYLLDHFGDLPEKKKKAFYSEVDGLISGGDKITPQENKLFEDVFKTTLVNGYGNNEGWGCLTVNSILHNRYGSVGIPKYDEEVQCFDMDTGEMLPFNEKGEICFRANTAFLYYLGNEYDTSDVRKTHDDGQVWIHTGDLGYVDDDGFVFLEGRARRVIIRQGFKISAYTIEDKVCDHPLVKECVAVEVIDPVEEHVPMVFIVLKEGVADKEDALAKIKDFCSQGLKEYEIPKHFLIVDELPYTQNGKYDFRALESRGNQYVDSL